MSRPECAIDLSASRLYSSQNHLIVICYPSMYITCTHILQIFIEGKRHSHAHHKANLQKQRLIAIGSIFS